MTDTWEDINTPTVAPSGIKYVYVGSPERRMRLRHEPWGLGWVWSANESHGGVGRGAVFAHWHEMMAYALQRQELTPAEYQAAYDIREVK